jgi:glycerate kinase
MFDRNLNDKTDEPSPCLETDEPSPCLLSCFPGAGAAGGLGAGCMAFLNASLKSGIDAILELYDFKTQLNGADFVITGEGKLDSQSFQGKVLSGILRESGDVPVIVICGVCDCDRAILEEKGITVFEASEGVTIKESMEQPEKYLRLAAQKAMRFAGQGGRMNRPPDHKVDG